MRSRLISLSLPKTEYDRLCEVAEAEERDPIQQARWILRRALAGDTEVKEYAMSYASGPAGRSRGPGARAIQSYALAAPAVGAATAVLAATSSAAASVVTAGITSPAVPRNLTCTPGGTTTNVLAVSVIIAGTDITGKAITETLPAFTAGAATAVTSVKAFATVTSVTIPIVGAATTVAVGTGAKLGMPALLTRNTVLGAWFNGVKEVTPPTVTTHATDVAQTLIQLSSALNGSPVAVDFYES